MLGSSNDLHLHATKVSCLSVRLYSRASDRSETAIVCVVVNSAVDVNKIKHSIFRMS